MAQMRSAAMSAIPPLSGQKQTFRPRLACVDAPPSLDGGAAAAFVGKLSGLVAAALPARDHAAVVPFRVSPRGQSRVSFNGQQKSILLVVKKTFVCRLKELSTAIDPVSVGGGFGFSENPGRPLGHLAERCAIYLQPHHILLGYVCDRY
jgi:hypothetical protein